MEVKAMLERTIILPTKDNTGRRLSYRISRIKQELLGIAGGYSEVKQFGQWKAADGSVYSDRALRIVTTVDESQDEQITARLPEWCAQLGQLALYTHASRVEVTFVTPKFAVTQIA
jgi:hypothetical protein